MRGRQRAGLVLGVTLISGDCRHQKSLEAAGLAKARGVLILTSDDLVSISTALMVRHLRPSVRVCICVGEMPPWIST